MKKFAVYLDMDGVLADFDSGAKALGFDLPPNARRANLSPEQREMKNKLYAAIRRTNFFATLPKMPGADELWNHVMTNHVGAVLTAIPSFKKEDPSKVSEHKARQEKASWIFNGQLPLPDALLFIAATSRDKYKYLGRMAPHLPQVLIDDRKDNCEEWEAAGGIAIHYQTFEQAMRELHYLEVS